MAEKSIKASYYGWYPVVDTSRDVISVLLTRGVNTQSPIRGQVFVAEILEAVGLKSEPVMFGCDEFVTCYFGGKCDHAASWEECWDLRILLPLKNRKNYLNNLSAFPFRQQPDEVGQVRDQIPIRVLADFEGPAQVKRCQESLQEQAQAQTLKWPDRYSVRTIGSHQHQLCIDVATVSRPAIQSMVHDAMKIMTICQRMGGRTEVATNSQRIK